MPSGVQPIPGSCRRPRPAIAVCDTVAQYRSTGCACRVRRRYLMLPIYRVWQTRLLVYSAYKMCRQMIRNGIALTLYTVERLVRRIDLRDKAVRTKLSDHSIPCLLDRVGREFKVERPKRLNPHHCVPDDRMRVQAAFRATRVSRPPRRFPDSAQLDAPVVRRASGLSARQSDPPPFILHRVVARPGTEFLNSAGPVPTPNFSRLKQSC